MQVPTAYEEAIVRRHPEQVALAIAKDQHGKFNPITLGWTMLTSHEPPMIAVSVGLTRYSLEVIRGAGEFVVCFPSSTMTAEALAFGTKSGRDVDKLATSGVKTQPATAIDGVLLSDAVANFECRLLSELQTGDHVIFVGQVIAAHANQDATLRRLYSLGHDLLGGLVPS